MSADVTKLDRDRIRELFDLRSETNAGHGGSYDVDPYPAFHRLRTSGPIHEGVVHRLIGYDGEAFFQGLPYPDRPHFSVFSFAECDEAFRNSEVFVSHPNPEDPSPDRDGIGVQSSMLNMNGAQHRRYRGLVQPSFVPNKAKWWIERWIDDTVQALAANLEELERADLNIDFAAAIPVLTITGSFGIGVEEALDLRETLRESAYGDAHDRFVGILEPILRARRESPEDDLISVLAHAEMRDDDGVVHRLSDAEIYSFSYLLLAAGSGTTWKQMGIVLSLLLERPELMAAVRADRALLRPVIEEAVRWSVTDPMFSRFVAEDTELGGVPLPAGAVVHLCTGAANRDPARWSDPDVYDPYRPPQPNLGFGGGAHICLGMHVARAEMFTGISALLDRFPEMRLDPDEPAPRIIGIYERGPDAVPVVLGPPAST